MAQKLIEILDSGRKKAESLGTQLVEKATKAGEAVKDGTERLYESGRATYESAAGRVREFADEHADEIAKVRALAASLGKSTAEMTADALKDLRAGRLGRNMATSGAAGAPLGTPVPLIGTVTGALLGAALGAYITLTTEEKLVERIPYQSRVAIALDELERMRKEGLINSEEFEQQKESVLAEARAARALASPQQAGTQPTAPAASPAKPEPSAPPDSAA